MKITLTIAGSDSSGGAGIQADLKTFTALGCYGASAITALTAQNTLGVQGVYPTPPAFLQSQIESIFDDLDVNAIKTGMLYDAGNIQAIVRCLKRYQRRSSSTTNTDIDDTAREVPIPLVCDPVFVSTSGHTLFEPAAVAALVDELFPLATLITPNKLEAEHLLQHLNLRTSSTGDRSKTIDSLEGMLIASRALLSCGSEGVLLKGGHLTTNLVEIANFMTHQPEVEVVKHGLLGENMEILKIGKREVEREVVVADLLSMKDGKSVLFIRPWIDSKNTHGTGCTLSAALACELALGYSVKEATDRATLYTHQGIVTAKRIGQGHGPLNHMHNITHACVPLPSSTNPYPLTQYFIHTTRKVWKDYVEHEFVVLLGRGTLPKENFIKFIKQDYHYLKYYARAYALLAAKSDTFTKIDTAMKTILGVLREIGTHRMFCAKFGVTGIELDTTPEELATTAYGCYLMDVGLQGDTTKLLMALLSCLLGYGEVGLWLKRESERLNTWVKMHDNPYEKWIEDYSGEGYQAAVKLGLDIIEKKALDDPPSPARLEEWRSVWQRCTLFEKGFWDMAMQK